MIGPQPRETADKCWPSQVELLKKISHNCTAQICNVQSWVDAVHYKKKTKIICLFSIVIRRQIPNCKTESCWIRIGQRLKGCGSFRVSSGSGRVWLTPTLENQWLDADKNPPRGFSFRYTSGAAPAPKLPIFFVKTRLNQACRRRLKWKQCRVPCLLHPLEAK